MSTKPATADEQAQIRELATRLLDVLDEYADFDHRITLAAIVDVLGVALGCVPCAECRRLSAKHLKGSVRDVYGTQWPSKNADLPMILRRHNET